MTQKIAIIVFTFMCWISHRLMVYILREKRWEKEMDCMANDKKRILWIDGIRGLGILFIILAHIVQYFPKLSGLNTYICSFHVPLFFIIVGVRVSLVGKNNNLKMEIEKGWSRLLVPFFVFSCVNFMTKFIGLFLVHQYTETIFWSEVEAFWILGNGTVWFLQTLFFANMLFAIIYSLKSKYKNWLIGLLGIVLIIIVNLTGNMTSNLDIVWKRTAMALAMIMFGYIIQTILIETDVIKHSYTHLLAGVFLLATSCYLNTFHKCEFAYYQGEFQGGWLSVGINLMASWGWIFVVQGLFENTYRKEWAQRFVQFVKDALIFLGGNTISFMVIHPILLMGYIYIFGVHVEEMPALLQSIIAMGFYILMIIALIPISYVFDKNALLKKTVGK